MFLIRLFIGVVCCFCGWGGVVVVLVVLVELFFEIVCFFFIMLRGMLLLLLVLRVEGFGMGLFMIYFLSLYFVWMKFLILDLEGV